MLFLCASRGRPYPMVISCGDAALYRVGIRETDSWLRRDQVSRR